MEKLPIELEFSPESLLKYIESNMEKNESCAILTIGHRNYIFFETNKPIFVLNGVSENEISFHIKEITSNEIKATKVMVKMNSELDIYYSIFTY